MLASIRSTFEDTRTLLVNDRLKLTGAHAEKQVGIGTGTVLKADLLAEQRLVPVLCKLWPGIPVLCEEAENSELPKQVPGISLVPYHDDVADLPGTLISVDGLDGSALYANGELSLAAMSAGLIENGQPVAALVMMLEEGRLYHTGFESTTAVCRDNDLHETWVEPKRPLEQCLIGLDDNRAVDAQFRHLVISKLNSRSYYPLNVPTVAGAIKVLRGNLAAYVTSNARHWDITGAAALCQAAGMIVRLLDGSPIPWHCVRMPPVVFARDEETFDYIQQQITEYRNAQKGGSRDY